MMVSTNQRRLDHRGAWRRGRTACSRVLALCAALLVATPSIRAAAAADAADANAGPSLTGRLGEIAGAVYGQAQQNLIAPTLRAAEEVLADPRAQKIYRDLSEATQDLAARADADAVQSVFQRSYRAVSAIAQDCAARLRLWVLDPLVARLKRAANDALEAPSAPAPATRLTVAVAADPFRERLPTPDIAPAASAPRPATAIGADPFRRTVAIPGVPDSDILRNLEGNDPLEPFNRLMFRLNGGLQSKLLDPVSRLYLDHTSPGVQYGVGNFFRNLREPATIVSSALEGQFDDAGTSAARFGINTTLGIAGFRDPATELGFTVRPRNFEETLCVYGLPSGPYLVLPVLGPATLRDTAGRIATVVMYFEVMGASVYIPYRFSDITVQYASVKENIDLINKFSPDPYVAQKALYLALHELNCGQQAVAYREFFTK